MQVSITGYNLPGYNNLRGYNLAGYNLPGRVVCRPDRSPMTNVDFGVQGKLGERYIYITWGEGSFEELNEKLGPIAMICLGQAKLRPTHG